MAGWCFTVLDAKLLLLKKKENLLSVAWLAHDVSCKGNVTLVKSLFFSPVKHCLTACMVERSVSLQHCKCFDQLFVIQHL